MPTSIKKNKKDLSADAVKDEMDILRETGSIAAAHASIALSEILNTKITLNQPVVNIISAKTILEKFVSDKIIMGIYSQMLSGFKGNVLFLLDETSIFKLVDACYNPNQEEKKRGVLTEIGISTIKEVGSVVISSYVTALSMILKTLIIPSIPTMLNGPIQQVMSMTVLPLDNKNNLLLIETVFEEPKRNIKGCFYLILNPAAMKYILNFCKKMLASISKT